MGGITVFVGKVAAQTPEVRQVLAMAFAAGDLAFQGLELALDGVEGAGHGGAVAGRRDRGRRGRRGLRDLSLISSCHIGVVGRVVDGVECLRNSSPLNPEFGFRTV